MMNECTYKLRPDFAIYTQEAHEIITSISNITLVKQSDKFVQDTSNYQNYCKNKLDLNMDLSYKGAKLDILIISLVCSW